MRPISKTIRPILFVLPVALLFAVSGCSANAESTSEPDTRQAALSDEESGIRLALDETYDQVRNGAHLVLAYDAKSNSFKGTVKNTTDNPMKKVRVEVHLSNGTELGPTIPTNLNPGESLTVNLETDETNFDGWSAHPEVGESGGGEDGHGEGDNEHGDEDESEHTKEGSD